MIKLYNLVLSCHPSLPTGLLTASSTHLCWMVNICIPVEAHRRMLLMHSSLPLQQCAPCLIHLTCNICEMGHQ